MKFTIISLITFFLLGCTTPSSFPEEYDVLVQIRKPETIKRVGQKHGYKNALGLAYMQGRKCKIMVPALNQSTLKIHMHEYRHCTEGKWHPH